MDTLFAAGRDAGLAADFDSVFLVVTEVFDFVVAAGFAAACGRGFTVVVVAVVGVRSVPAFAVRDSDDAATALPAAGAFPARAPPAALAVGFEVGFKVGFDATGVAPCMAGVRDVAGFFIALAKMSTADNEWIWGPRFKNQSGPRRTNDTACMPASSWRRCACPRCRACGGRMPRNALRS
ncbi:MAG: hypothetical protein ACTHL1_00670 [Burkholderiaceae bacterium]